MWIFTHGSHRAKTDRAMAMARLVRASSVPGAAAALRNSWNFCCASAETLAAGGRSRRFRSQQLMALAS